VAGAQPRRDDRRARVHHHEAAPTPDAGDAFSLSIPPGFQPVKSAPDEVSAGFPPMLFSLPDAGPRRMLVLNQGREGTSFDVLSPEVVGASRDWLFLAGDAPNELRVIPLPLTR